MNTPPPDGHKLPETDPATITPAPAEWRVDPNNPNQWRYFNGIGWTDRVAERDPNTNPRPVYGNVAVVSAAMAVLWTLPIRNINLRLGIAAIGFAVVLTYIADRRAVRTGTSRRVTAASCILTLVATMFLLINLVKLL